MSETILKLLWLNAWLAIQDGNPELVPTIRDGVAAGKAQADILKECAAIGPGEDVLGGAQMAIEYLQTTPLEEQLATKNAIQAKRQMLADPAMKERLFQAKLARLRQMEEQADDSD